MTGKIFLFLAIVVLTVLFMAGCTDLERRGYSTIPQNRPAAWETSPFSHYNY